MQTRTKESRKRLQSLILLTAFTCVLLIVSTYAWFTTQKDVNVSNIRAKVEVAEGLSISLDGAKWTQELDLGNALDSTNAKYQGANASLDPQEGESFEYMPYTGHRNHVPDEFLPVSTSADIVSVTGASGNVAKYELGMYTGKYEGNKTKLLSGIKQANENSTAVSDADYAGYYAFDIFLKNTSKTGVTSDILQLNSDAYAWVLPEGEDITVGSGASAIVYDGDYESGLQNSIRVAFARYGEGVTNAEGNNIVKASADQSTILEQTADDSITAVAIWEPNHNDHVQRIISNVSGLFPEGKSPLPTTYPYDTYKPFWVGTLSKDISGNVDNPYNWETAGIKKIPTLQTTTTTTEEGGLFGHTVEGVQNLITTASEKPDPSQETGSYTPLTLAANSVTRFRVYVYIEGQDPDCDTDASQGGGIEVNIGLTKGEEQGSMDRYNEVYNPDGIEGKDRAKYDGGSITKTADPS